MKNADSQKDTELMTLEHELECLISRLEGLISDCNLCIENCRTVLNGVKVETKDSRVVKAEKLAREIHLRHLRNMME